MGILNIKNPETGQWEPVPYMTGPPGADGHTPVKGVDYYTLDEKAELEAYIATELAKRGQLKPEFANSIEECTDTTKLYVLPDGYIYAYMLSEVKPVNQIPISTDTDRVTIYSAGDGSDGYATQTRLSSDGSTKSSTTAACTTGFIPASAGDVLKVHDIDHLSGVAEYIIAYNSSNAVTGYVQVNTSSGGGSLGIYDSAVLTDVSYELTLTEALFGSGFDAIRICTVIDENTSICVESGNGPDVIYQWTNTGHAFVPADYEGRITALEEAVEELKDAADSETDNELMYIAPDGDDSNSGLSASVPKKTVTACVAAGAKRISAKRGVYAEQVSLNGIDTLEIFPTDNDQAYSTESDWPPIVFDLSDTLAVSGLENYNAIKRISYSASANEQFNKVFVAQSQTPVIGDGYGSRYNATVWLMSSDEKAVCLKLKPVLTIAECEAEANTFSYADGFIYLNADLTGAEKIVVPTNWDSGFRIANAGKVILREVEVRFSGSYNVWILNCSYFDLYKCASKYTSYGSGFDINNANGVFTACYATKNYDGFGISGYGHTTYIDCISEFNFDDGVSHHNGSEGTFIGGRYEGNGKGGNTPAYGAKVNIYGGIYKDNSSFGIGYLYTSTRNPASGIVQGVVMDGNAIGLKVGANCRVTAISCIYENNTTDKDISGIVTEY